MHEVLLDIAALWAMLRGVLFVSFYFLKGFWDNYIVEKIVVYSRAYDWFDAISSN
jgi:hypothetical protein